MNHDLESLACAPQLVQIEHFNPNAALPYNCTIQHLFNAMNDFIAFLGFVNDQLHSKGMTRIETMLMPANFSSMVGEFMASQIPKHCALLARNQYHNGHPDLIPKNRFANDSVQYTHDGIEIKASRYLQGWQGHNPENIWLMVFIFNSNRPIDKVKGIEPFPFRFRAVVGAQLQKRDWTFSGRSASSRRTITASVTASGYEKMTKNWLYKESGLDF